MKFSLKSIHKISVNSKGPIYFRVHSNRDVPSSDASWFKRLEEWGHKVTILGPRIKIEWQGAKA